MEPPSLVGGGEKKMVYSPFACILMWASAGMVIVLPLMTMVLVALVVSWLL